VASVFGFVLAFCYKAHLEERLSEDEIETLWQAAAQAVRTQDWLLMLNKIGPDMLGLEMKFGQAIEEVGLAFNCRGSSLTRSLLLQECPVRGPASAQGRACFLPRVIIADHTLRSLQGRFYVVRRQNYW
jgi:hypothetical protein